MNIIKKQVMEAFDSQDFEAKNKMNASSIRLFCESLGFPVETSMEEIELVVKEMA